MRTEWHSTIDALYEAFKAVVKPHHVAGCPCCTSDGEFHSLLKKPLRELAPDELGRYASKALTTVGTEEDFHYFAPRILEIAATDDGWWPEPAIIASRMQMANWSSWPAEQVAAIRALLHENFLRLLEQDDCGSRVDDWICAVGTAGEDLTPYLDELERRPEKLLRFYEQNSESLLKGRLSGPFWGDAVAARETVLKWIRSPRTVEIINQGYGMNG